MKLRIQGDSIRLRLKQAEIAELADRGRVVDRMRLPGRAAFTYGCEVGRVSRLSLDWRGFDLWVILPRDVATAWTSSDEVSIEASVALGVDSDELRVLVEKDFRCLHKRVGEDESDNYPHPAES